MLADHSFHHKLVLEVANLAAVQSLALLHTQNPVSALQLEGLFATAEVVDEVSELVDVLQALGHHHLLMDQVRLRQVGAGLDVDKQLQKVFGRHDDGGVEWDDVALVQTQIQVGGQPPLEVVDDVCRVSVIKLRHRDVDQLHLFPLQHPDFLLQLSQAVLVWQLHINLQTSKAS